MWHNISEWGNQPLIAEGKPRGSEYMGFFDWLRRGHDEPAKASSAPAASPAAKPAAPAAPKEEWEPVPAYLPVDASEHRPVVVAATAIAAGDRPDSQMVVRRVSIVNPEHRLVSCIAASIAAGALETSQFVVKGVYKKVMEEDHAS